MEDELHELGGKINKAEEFLLKEDREPKFLDEKQKELLELQVTHMKHYYSTLKKRIQYDYDK
ncbi:MAG: crAss001_48 related protein [Bacteroidales bacterium]